MFSHYQSLFQCNESVLALWSKPGSNPHLSRLSVSHSASYNLHLNLCPQGPKLCWAVGAALQRPRSFPRRPIVYALTAPLKHLRQQSDTLCQGRGLLGLLAVGHEMEEQRWCSGGWRLDAFTSFSPPSNPDDKTYGLRYDVAGQCLIAKTEQEPSFALSV